MSDKIEQAYILMEAAEIDFSDEYFAARPQIDGNDRRNVFKAGFERGYKAGQTAIPPTNNKVAKAIQLLELSADPFDEACMILRSISPDIRTCSWRDMENENMPGTYQGTCGITWSFIDRGIKENELIYCPRCGGQVHERPAEELES